MDQNAATRAMERAILYQQAGLIDDAKKEYRIILESFPTSPLVLNNLAVILTQEGDAAQATDLLELCLSVAPHYVEAVNNLGLAHSAAGKDLLAREAFERAVSGGPDQADYRYNLGVVLQKLGEMKKASAAFEDAARLNPEDAGVWNSLGDVSRNLGEWNKAERSYRASLALDPGNAEILNNLGVALERLGRYEESVVILNQAVEADPDQAISYVNLGYSLEQAGRCEEAVGILDRALFIDPDCAPAHLARASALLAANRRDEAEESCRLALGCDPESSAAYNLMAKILKGKGDPAGVLECYEKAFAIAPAEYSLALIYARMALCDWRDWPDLARQAEKNAPNSETPPSPFAFFSLPSSPKSQQTVARRWMAYAVRGAQKIDGAKKIPGEGKVKIGYVSGDFHDHPVGRLFVGFIEKYDRSSFETFGYETIPGTDDAIHRRIAAALDHVVDISALSDHDAALKIAADGIDILVDLTGGGMAGGRPFIFACRPAPVQVSYLGTPGSMGAEFIDYIIADSYLVPEDQQQFYSEKIVRLPDCYQPGDPKRPIPSFSRDDVGAGMRALVLASFNNNYKITPDVFAVWMRLLSVEDNATLWLYAPQDRAQENLRGEIKKAGAPLERVVFFGRASAADYMGRLAAADLFLDCFPYNAGATANDALWAGTPVLTLSGETYAARMAGSLLTALGLDELIARSLPEYEEKARWLASHPKELEKIRRRLAHERENGRLFDMGRYARGLDKAFMEMAKKARRGERPGNIGPDGLSGV